MTPTAQGPAPKVPLISVRELTKAYVMGDQTVPVHVPIGLQVAQARKCGGWCAGGAE